MYNPNHGWPARLAQLPVLLRIGALDIIVAVVQIEVGVESAHEEPGIIVKDPWYRSVSGPSENGSFLIHVRHALSKNSALSWTSPFLSYYISACLADRLLLPQTKQCPGGVRHPAPSISAPELTTRNSGVNSMVQGSSKITVQRVFLAQFSWIVFSSPTNRTLGW